MPTGRLTVAPGQVIASAWGNTTFDQSVMCFASDADRNNQYAVPSRHPGAITFLEDVKRLELWDGTGWRRISNYRSADTLAWQMVRQRYDQVAAGTWGAILTLSLTNPRPGVYSASGALIATAASAYWTRWLLAGSEYVAYATIGAPAFVSNHIVFTISDTPATYDISWQAGFSGSAVGFNNGSHMAVKFEGEYTQAYSTLT